MNKFEYCDDICLQQQKRKRKLVIVVGILITTIACFFIIFNIKKNNEGDAALLKGNRIVKKCEDNKNNCNFDYLLNIDKSIRDVPVIKSKYDLRIGAANVDYYKILEYSAVMDTFDQTGLQVISAHDYSFFKNLSIADNKSVLTLKDVKNNKVIRYEFIKKDDTNKWGASKVYNTNLDPKEYLVTYTCESGFSDFMNPQKRIYVYWKKTDTIDNKKYNLIIKE